MNIVLLLLTKHDSHKVMTAIDPILIDSFVFLLCELLDLKEKNKYWNKEHKVWVTLNLYNIFFLERN